MGPRQTAFVDDEEEIAEQTAEFKGSAPQARIIQCPECPFEGNGDQVGSHIERHRPMGFPIYSKRGKLVSCLCPKGCGRYFNRPKDALEVPNEGQNNSLNELRFHVLSCDGSSRISTVKEEEDMAKRKGRSFKRKVEKDEADAIVGACPACPDLKFPTQRARGQHLRAQHPGWKEDPRFNPDAGQTTPPPTPPVDDEASAIMAEEVPLPAGAGGRADRGSSLMTDVEQKAKNAKSQARLAIARMRESAEEMRAKVKTFTEEADDLDATADAMEKALEN